MPHKHRPILSICLVLCLLASLATADFIGQVIDVIDGDTLKIMHNGKLEEVRLHGIDCPERNRAFGRRAKQFTSAETLGKEVTVTATGRDRNNHLMVEIVLADGRTLNSELVKAGWCSELLSGH